MRGRTIFLIGATVAMGTLGATAILLAQEHAQPKDRATDQKSQPVAEHKNLDAFVGTWQVTGQCFEKSETAPEACTGTVKSEWILGNRFVKCHMNGTKGSQSVEGMGATGYDNGKNKYVSTWLDDQCNAIKMEEGTYEQGSKTFTYAGEGVGPDGQTIKCRRIIKIVSNDEHTMTAFITEPGKTERKVAEITFRRTSRTARADEGAVTP